MRKQVLDCGSTQSSSSYSQTYLAMSLTAGNCFSAWRKLFFLDFFIGTLGTSLQRMRYQIALAHEQSQTDHMDSLCYSPDDTHYTSGPVGFVRSRERYAAPNMSCLHLTSNWDPFLGPLQWGPNGGL